VGPPDGGPPGTERRGGSLAEKRTRPILGWREWIRLPDLGFSVKAKVDTGARSSALHAFDVHTVEKGGQTLVLFRVHPIQRDSDTTVEVAAPLVGLRRVRNSGGHAEMRPVVKTPVELLGLTWPVEITLTRRDVMGFRMLLGRQAVRKRFLIDPGSSFLGGRRRPGGTTP